MTEEWEEFQWTFSINDVVKFEETEIAIYANTYEQAIRKVKSLKLPSLKTLDDVEDNLKLTRVYEMDAYYDRGTSDEEEEVSNPGNDDE